MTKKYMASKTIAEFANSYTQNNIKIGAGDLKIVIVKSPGSITVSHNFSGTGFVSIPANNTITLESHIGDHGHIKSIKVEDINGAQISLENDLYIAAY